MSNDLISVPRELLERWTTGKLTAGDSATIGRLLAQPNTCTKDGGPVRPPEPVAYADPKAFENFRIGSATHEWMWAMSDTGLIPLFSHPPAQAPVVLPERMEYQKFGTVPVISDAEVERWNACIDELKRLNPTL